MFKKLMMMLAVAFGLAGCAVDGKIDRDAVTCLFLSEAAGAAVAQYKGDVTKEQAEANIKLALVQALMAPKGGEPNLDEAARAAVVNNILAKVILTDKVSADDVALGVYTACMSKDL